MTKTSNGLVYFEVLDLGQTVTADIYKDQLNRVDQALRRQGVETTSTKFEKSLRKVIFERKSLWKKSRNRAGKSCLIRLTAQTWHHPNTICSGRCSTSWPRESSQTAKKSNSGCPTTFSRSRPSSSKEESILCIYVGNKSLLVMEIIF